MRRLIPLLVFITLSLPAMSHATRVKDMSWVQGVRSNKLVGYGLVVGLNDTGDDYRSTFTLQSLVTMLRQMGVKIDSSTLRVRNVAAVIVTAELPPFTMPGARIDVTISSIGNADSLQGGVLVMTPLRAANGEVYAVAQGPLSVGGYSFSGASGSVSQKNHTTTARIPNGATIERKVEVDLNGRDKIVLVLRESDFSTAANLAKSVNEALEGDDNAKAMDPGTVVVTVPESYEGNIVGLVAAIEQLQVKVDRPAKVVINERTGTIIMGSNVRISTVAISHGPLHISIREQPEVSQPQPFSQGQTVVVPRTQLEVTEREDRLRLVEEGVSIGEVVRALNALGVSPRDLVDILQAIKIAGALDADLEII